MQPSDYRVRESRRARRVRFVVSRLDGLEVVVPVGFDQARIPELVHGRQAWLARVTARFVAEAARAGPEQTVSLPETVLLRALGEEWRVVYRLTDSSRVTARERRLSQGAASLAATATRGPERPLGLLVVSGNVRDGAACRAALARWLGRKARGYLPAALATEAEDTGLGYSDVTLRAQRTRWGSCSRRRIISLNRTLLFLPVHLVEYVLVHELCHTVEMNHSPRFWAMVERYRPNSMASRRELKTASFYVPRWVELWMDERSGHRRS